MPAAGLAFCGDYVEPATPQTCHVEVEVPPTRPATVALCAAVAMWSRFVLSYETRLTAMSHDRAQVAATSGLAAARNVIAAMGATGGPGGAVGGDASDPWLGLARL